MFVYRIVSCRIVCLFSAFLSGKHTKRPLLSGDSGFEFTSRRQLKLLLGLILLRSPHPLIPISLAVVSPIAREKGIWTRWLRKKVTVLADARSKVDIFCRGCVGCVDEPEVSVGSKARHVGLDETLTLECHVSAKPPARLSWKHNGSDVIGRVNVVVGASSVDYCSCQQQQQLTTRNEIKNKNRFFCEQKY